MSLSKKNKVEKKTFGLSLWPPHPQEHQHACLCVHTSSLAENRDRGKVLGRPRWLSCYLSSVAICKSPVICGFFFGGPAQTSMGLGDPIAQVRTCGSPACNQLEWGPPWSTLFVSAVNCDDRVQVTRDLTNNTTKEAQGGMWALCRSLGSGKIPEMCIHMLMELLTSGSYLVPFLCCDRWDLLEVFLVKGD